MPRDHLQEAREALTLMARAQAAAAIGQLVDDIARLEAAARRATTTDHDIARARATEA